MLSRSLKIYFVIQFSSHNRTGERISKKKNNNILADSSERKRMMTIKQEQEQEKRVIMSNRIRHYGKKCKFRFEIEQSKNVPNLTGEKIEAH